MTVTTKQRPPQWLKKSRTRCSTISDVFLAFNNWTFDVSSEKTTAFTETTTKTHADPTKDPQPETHTHTGVISAVVVRRWCSVSTHAWQWQSRVSLQRGPAFSSARLPVCPVCASVHFLTPVWNFGSLRLQERHCCLA